MSQPSWAVCPDIESNMILTVSVSACVWLKLAFLSDVSTRPVVLHGASGSHISNGE